MSRLVPGMLESIQDVRWGQMAIPQVRESWPLLGKLPSRWPLQTGARSGQAASAAASNIYKAARPLREETLLRPSQLRLHAPR